MQLRREKCSKDRLDFCLVPRVVCTARKEFLSLNACSGWNAFVRMSQVNQRGQICMRAFAEIERRCERLCETVLMSHLKTLKKIATVAGLSGWFDFGRAEAFVKPLDSVMNLPSFALASPMLRSFLINMRHVRRWTSPSRWIFDMWTAIWTS